MNLSWYSTSADSPYDIERTARRLATYIESGHLQVTEVTSAFGLAGGTRWVILRFTDDRDAICLPIPSPT